MADHRQDYSPTKLYVNGRRMMEDFTAEDAVEDYMRMHPEADEELVQVEIETVRASRTPI